MKRWAMVGLASLGIGAGCDADYAASADAADADDNETLAYEGGAYGADPESGTFVPGTARYSPSDPDLNDEVVVFGRAHRDAGHVISRLSEWEGGPVVALAGTDAAAVALAVAASAPVVSREAETGSWLVTSGRPVIAEGPTVAAAWAAREPGDVKLPPVAGNAFLVRLPVALARVPDELREMIGAEVRVFDDAREVCIARVSGLELEARLVHEPLGPWDPAYSEREILQRGLRSLVATLEPLAGAADACAQGVVAVGVRAASPRLYLPKKVTPSLRRKAVAALCGLSPWKVLAASDSLDARPWSHSCYEVEQRGEVLAFETRAGEPFVVVSSDRIHAGYRETDHGLELAWAHVSDAAAEAIIDVQGDGTPELVLGASERAPAAVAGVRFAGDLSEPTFMSDWTPVPPQRKGVGGFAVPDYSVFRAR